ncbi:MAG: hypothetical protein LBL86_04070 [Coriobacteriales bacterium]|jgi:hypothetical protein|nr:hypothetical protein [Coriobacteriales bacterium]
MKKVVALAGVIVAVLLFAFLSRFIPIGYLDFSSLALTTNELERNLAADEVPEEARVITPDTFETFSPLWERAGAIFVGEEKVRLNAAYPIFANDATAVMTLNDSSKLITDNFDRIGTYANLIVSDGSSFNKDRQKADEENFILLALPNNIFINAQDAKVGSTDIIANSVLYFTPTSLRMYLLKEGAFHYERIDGLTDTSTIVFGDRVYNYHDLLRNLGLMPTESSPVTPPNPDPIVDLPDDEPATTTTVQQPQQPAEAEAVHQVREKQPAKPQPAVAGDPADPPEPPKDEERFFEPVVRLSTVQGVVQPGETTGYIQSSISASDRSRAIVSDIMVYLFDASGTQVGSASMAASEIVDGRGSKGLRFDGLTKGQEYLIYGTYTYRNEEGALVDVRFGEQRFVLKNDAPPPRPPVDPGYVEPEVSVDGWVPDVYHIGADLHLKDPANRIRGGVVFSIYRLDASGDKVFLRRALRTNGQVRIGFLPPGEKYRVEVSYQYDDEYDVRMQRRVATYEFETLTMDALGRSIVRFANGDLFSRKIQVSGVSFDLSSDPRVIEATDRMALVVDGKDYYLNRTAINEAKAGNPVTVETTTGLASNTNFNYNIVCYDPFGNVLTKVEAHDHTPRLKAGGNSDNPADYVDTKDDASYHGTDTGLTHTCQDAPRAALSLTARSVGKTGFRISLTNADLVELRDLRVTFYEFDDTELLNPVGIRVLADPDDLSSYGALQTSYTLDAGPYSGDKRDFNLAVANFSLTEVYRAVVTADFNLHDKRPDALGNLDDEVISTYQFTPAPLDSLGSVVFQTKFLTSTDRTASLDFNVNSYATLQAMRDLLVEMRFTITAPGDLTPTQTLVLRRDSADPLERAAFEKVLQGGIAPNTPYTWDLTGLKSRTEYAIGITAKVRVIDTDYDVPTSNDLASFTTRRQQPRGVIKAGDIFTTTDSVYLYRVSVEDPDEVIKSTVTMNVRDAATGRTVYLVRVTPNMSPGQDFIIRNLDKMTDYIITFTAADYNDAYDANDYTSQRTNQRLPVLASADGGAQSDRDPVTSLVDNCYLARTVDSLSGHIELRGIANQNNDANSPYLDVSLRTTITDVLGNLAGTDQRYFLRTSMRPGYGEYVSIDGNPSEGVPFDLIDDPLSPDNNNVTDPSVSPPQKDWLDDAVTALQRKFEFHVELWVRVANRDIMLDDVYFDTSSAVRAIDRPQKMLWLQGTTVLGEPGDRYGRYIVVADMVNWYYANDPSYDPAYDAATKVDATNVSRAKTWWGNIRDDGNTPFEGSIDFQGHSFYMPMTTGEYNKGTQRQSFIRVLGPRGIVKNVEVDYELAGENPATDTYYSFIYANRGLISNVKVNVIKYPTAYNYATSPLLYSNEETGILENVAVDMRCDTSTRGYFGLVSVYNNGLIRSAYVYSSTASDTFTPRIYVPIVTHHDGAAAAFGAIRIGSIVGSNSSMGEVTGCYSLIPVEAKLIGTANRTIDRNTIGTLVGYNDGGRVRQSYTLAEPTVDGAISPTGANGPGVGGQASSARTNTYYIAPTNYTNTFNSPIKRDVLYDNLWQQAVLGAGFNTDIAATGFFPQLNWPYSMPQQDYIALPDLGTVTNIELSSILVEEQHQDYAIALATFKNPGFHEITGLAIGDLTVTRQGAQMNNAADGLSRVRWRLTNPQVFRSTYPVSDFWYRPANASTNYQVSVVNSVNAEFYKMIYTADDWRKINLDLTQNYRLANDLKLESLAGTELILGEGTNTAAKYFTGRLDGGYYDENYELMGTWTLDLANADVDPAGTHNAWGALITNLTGSLTNMRITNYTVRNDVSDYVGLVRYTQPGALIQNVHMYNTTLRGGYIIGSLVAEARYVEIFDSSSTKVRIEDSARTLPTPGETRFRAGGLVGWVGSSTRISNCFVSGLDMQISHITDSELDGTCAGGLVGYYDSGSITYVTAQGTIEAAAAFGKIGGLIGWRTSTQMLRYGWVDVDISSTGGGNLGALIGFNSTVAASSMADFDMVVLGNVKSTAYYSPIDTQRPARRIIGTAGGTAASGMEGVFKSTYFVDTQQINEKPYGDAATAGIDGGIAVSPAGLRVKQFYYMDTYMGDVFIYDPLTDASLTGGSYQGIEGGYMPLLLDRKGATLLPYQTPQLVESPQIWTLDVQAATNNDLDYSVTVNITHPAGAEVRYLTIDDIYVPNAGLLNDVYFTESKYVQGPTNTQTAMTFKFSANPNSAGAHLERFRDTYKITGIGLLDSTVAPVESQIVFAGNNIPFRTISGTATQAAATWVSWFSDPDNRDANENIRLMADLDFSGITVDQTSTFLNPRINRLLGATDTLHPGGWSEVRNLTMNLTAGRTGLIGTVNAQLQNFHFTDVTLNLLPTGSVTTDLTGIVVQSLGDVADLEFDRFKILAVNSTKNNVARRVGFIAQQMGGSVKNVTLRDVEIRSRGTSVGALVGIAYDPLFEDLTLTTATANPELAYPGRDDELQRWTGGDQVSNPDPLTAQYKNPNIIAGGSETGGIFGGAGRSMIHRLSAEWTTVYSATGGAYVGSIGGAVSYANYLSNVAYGESVARDVCVVSNSHAGGLYGQGGGVGASTADPILAERVTVVSVSAYAGGVFGVPTSYIRFVRAQDVAVFGNTRSGGINGGASYEPTFCEVLDSVISTTYDPQVTTWTGRTPLAPVAADSGNNRYIGGISGGGRAQYCAVVNCIIGAVDARDVGGVIGLYDTSGNIRDNEVKDCIVYGASNIGGVTGRLYNYPILQNVVANTTVTGSGTAVGGIAGHLTATQILSGGNTAYTYSNIFYGTVTGADYVGGIVGRTVGNLYDYERRDRNNHVMGDVVVTAGTHGSFLYNLDDSLPIGTRMNVFRNRIYEYSRMKISGVTKFAKDPSFGFATAYWEEYDLSGAGSVTAQHAENGDLTYANVNLTSDITITDAADALNGGHNRENLLYKAQHYTMTHTLALAKKNTGIRNDATADATRLNRTDFNMYWGLNSLTGDYATWVYGSIRTTTGPNGTGYLPYKTQDLYASGTRAGAPYTMGTDGSGGPGPGLGVKGIYNPRIGTNYATLYGTDPAFVGGNPLPAFDAYPTTAAENAYLNLLSAAAPASELTAPSLYTSATSVDTLTLEFPSILPTATIRIEALTVIPSEGAEPSALTVIPSEGAEPSALTVIPSEGAASGSAAAEESLAAPAANPAPSTAATESDTASTATSPTPLYEAPFTERTYTFRYDFVTPLTVTVTAQSGEATTFTIDPATARRTLLTWGDSFYHLEAAGVYAGDAETGTLLPGEFVNLAAGEALTASGDVYDLATGTVLRTTAAADIALLDATQPLFTAEYEGMPINTYANYSLIGPASGTLEQELRLFVKDDRLAALHPSLPVALGAVIMDEVTDADDSASGGSGGAAPATHDLLTVLGTDGVIADTTETGVVLPEGFNNGNIVEMTSNLSTSLPLAMVRYASGKVVAFDYLTGEERTLADAAGDISLIDYATSFLQSQSDSMLDLLPRGNSQLLNNSDYYLNAATPSAPGTATAPGSAAAAGTGTDAGTAALDGPGASDGASTLDGPAAAGGPASTDGPDSAADPSTVIPSDPLTVIPSEGGEAPAAEGSLAASAANPAPDSSASGDGSDTAGDDTFPSSGGVAQSAGVVSGDADDSIAPGVGNSSSSGGNSSSSGGPSGPSSGSLTRPEPKQQLLAVYNYDTDTYELFDQASMLGEQQASPLAAIEASTILGDVGTITPVGSNDSQSWLTSFFSDFRLAALALLVVTIAGLLIYLSVKRTRLR